jgi:type IX secretion system PorP/SprF family membrane protein
MKKLLIIIAAAYTTTSAAQQLPNYTQYMLNQYIINPALSGIESYTDVKMSHRLQWVGVRDAPVTTYFTVQGSVGKANREPSINGISPEGVNLRGREYWENYEAPPPHHGVGFQFVQDKAGALTRSSGFLTYAYHMALSTQTSVSAGFGAGMSSYRLNSSKLTLDQQNDPSINQNNVSSNWNPDVNAGIYLYSSDYFIGISAQQLLPQKIMFTNNSLRKEDGKMVPHLFLTAGYRFLLGEDFNLMPSVMIKQISPLPVQVDFSSKLQFREVAWLGATYRTKDGIAAMLGFNLRHNINFGYSYDYTTSGLNNYSKGTHEILLGFLIGNQYGDSCPRNIW